MKMIPEQVLNRVYVNFITKRVISKTKRKVMDLDKFVQKYDDPSLKEPQKPQNQNQQLQLDFNDEICWNCGSLKENWQVNKI